MIIIIIMNFYSPVSNTRCHSIGHKMRIARIKIRVVVVVVVVEFTLVTSILSGVTRTARTGRQSREMGKNLGRERNFEEVCFEPGTESW